MLVELLQHNSSFVILSVVLLEYSIFSWEDRHHNYILPVQLIHNDVQILWSVQGLIYHSHRSQRCPREHPPKYNIATTGLCMICCTLRKQLFTWIMVYHDMAITVMNDKLQFLTKQFSSTDPWSKSDVPGSSVGIVLNDAWSAKHMSELSAV